MFCNIIEGVVKIQKKTIEVVDPVFPGF